MRTLYVAAAALLSLAAAAPAQAATAEPDPPRGVFLTLSGGEGSWHRAESSWIRGVRLDCPPRPSGEHPYPVEACAALAAADGDLDELPADDSQICTKQYDPVTASAVGTYRGKPVDWTKTFANACEMEAETGYVFRF